MLVIPVPRLSSRMPVKALKGQVDARMNVLATVRGVDAGRGVDKGARTDEAEPN